MDKYGFSLYPFLRVSYILKKVNSSANVERWNSNLENLNKNKKLEKSTLSVFEIVDIIDDVIMEQLFKYEGSFRTLPPNEI